MNTILLTPVNDNGADGRHDDDPDILAPFLVIDTQGDGGRVACATVLIAIEPRRLTQELSMLQSILRAG